MFLWVLKILAKDLPANYVQSSTGILSYQNFTSNNSSQTQNIFSLKSSFNMNLGFAGQLKLLNNPLKFNSYFYSDSNNSSKIKNYLFTWGTKSKYLSYGDINRFYFTPLTVSSQTLKGGKFFTSFNEGKYDLSFVFAEVKEKKEGTLTTNGQYQQILTALRLVKNKEKAYFGMSYYKAKDKESSIKIPGPNLTPLNNDVLGFDYKYVPNEKINIFTEAVLTMVNEDQSTERKKGLGNAYSLNINYLFSENTIINFLFKQTNNRFYSVASVGALGDINKRKIQVLLNKNIPSFLNSNFTFSLANITNNIQYSTSKPKTLENTNNILWALSPANNLTLNFNYSLTKLNSNMVLKDETNNVFSSGANYIFLNNLKISPYYSVAKYRNKIYPNNDADTNNTALNFYIPLPQKLNFNYSLQKNNIKFVTSKTNSKTTTNNFSLGFFLLKDKLAGAVSTTFSKSQSLNQNINNKTKSLLLSASYKLNNLDNTLNLYYQQNQYEDYFNPANSYKTKNINLAYGINFSNEPFFKKNIFKGFYTQKNALVIPVVPFTIIINTPVQNELLKEPFIQLQGKIISSSKINKLTLNDKEIYFIPAEEVNFSYPLILTSTNNEFILKAENEAGNTIEKAISFVYDSKEPEIYLESPSVNETNIATITLSGKAIDDTGINTLLIDNIPYKVSGEKEINFNQEITLNEGENKIKISVIDKAGRETVEELSLTYLPKKVEKTKEEIKNEEIVKTKEIIETKPQKKIITGKINSISPTVILFKVAKENIPLIKENDIFYIKRKNEIIGKVKVNVILEYGISADVIGLKENVKIEFSDVITNEGEEK